MLVEEIDMRNHTLFLLMLFFIITITMTVHAKDLEEGVDYIWVDLGEENEGVMLQQEEQADGISEDDVQGGVECRKQPFPYGGPGNNHMYFRIDDSFMFGGENEVWIVMEYFDVGIQIDCQYDSNSAGAVDGAFRGAGDGAFDILNPTNTETWMFHVWYIPDGRFENRANGSDFRFSTHGTQDMWINRVWIMLTEPKDPFDPDDLSRAKAVRPENKIAVSWGTVKKDSIF